MPDLFKEIIPSILVTKENPFVDGDYSTFVPFITNRALAHHKDCLFLANMVNERASSLDKRQSYLFLFHSVKARKRPFQKWIKAEKPEDLELVKSYFGYSDRKAKEALSILSDEQLKLIRQAKDKGGK